VIHTVHSTSAQHAGGDWSTRGRAQSTEVVHTRDDVGGMSIHVSYEGNFVIDRVLLPARMNKLILFLAAVVDDQWINGSPRVQRVAQNPAIFTTVHTIRCQLLLLLHTLVDIIMLFLMVVARLLWPIPFIATGEKRRSHRHPTIMCVNAFFRQQYSTVGTINSRHNIAFSVFDSLYIIGMYTKLTTEQNKSGGKKCLLLTSHDS